VEEVELFELGIVFGAVGVAGAFAAFLVEEEGDVSPGGHLAGFDFEVGAFGVDVEDAAVGGGALDGDGHLDFDIVFAREAAVGGVEVAFLRFDEVEGLAVFVEEAELHLVELHVGGIFDFAVVLGAEFGDGAVAFGGGVNETLSFGIESAW